MYFLYNARGCTSQATCQKRQTENYTISHIVRHLLRIVNLEMWPLYILEIDYEKFFVRKNMKTLKKEWPYKILGFRSTWKKRFSFSGFHVAIIFSWFFFTVTLDRVSERGTTCSLVQKGFPQFSHHNALVLGGVIIN